MKSRIAHDVFASSRTLLGTGDVDANVSEALAARRLHHGLARSRIDEPAHERGVSRAQNRETIACFDREAQATAFQRELESASVASSSHRARAHERFGNHAPKNIQ
jgi:hypothetical protein